MFDNAILAQGLQWIYTRVAGDLTADERGASDADIDRWIAVASTQAGAVGFVTNLGGVFTLPVALPANLASTMAVQMRLVARIAAARGYDPQGEAVKNFVFACLLGNAAMDALKDAGLRVGMRLGQRVGPAVLARLQQTVLSRLAVRAGSQGAMAVTKFVPVVGGVIGGGMDAASTRVVGKVAKRMFPSKTEAPAAPADEAAPLLLAAPAGEGEGTA